MCSNFPIKSLRKNTCFRIEPEGEAGHSALADGVLHRLHPLLDELLLRREREGMRENEG